MKHHRVERVADMIAQEVSMILRTKSSDRRFTMVTVTGAKVSKDLRIAHVFVSVLGGDSDVEMCMQSLEAAQGFFRREIGRTLKLKFTPEIRFMFDDSLVRSQRIADELAEINAPDEHEGDACE